MSEARALLYADFETQLPRYGIFAVRAAGAVAAPGAGRGRRGRTAAAPAAAGGSYTAVNLTAPAALPGATRAAQALAARLQERLHYAAATLPPLGTSTTRGTEPEAARLARALPRLLLEQAYTQLNRLTALRLAEERGITGPGVIQKGMDSEGFELFSEYTRAALPEPAARYAAFLRASFDALAREVPGVFSATSPYGLLWPEPAALDAVLHHLRRPDLAFAWAADETLGWLYQYFNSDAERREMRKARAPRNAREMAVRNQFFTPRYVVAFLTDNTLGRRWRDVAGPSNALTTQCTYLLPELPADASSLVSPVLKPGDAEYALPDPRALRVLDPACGSMHFGLYAFEVLEMIYLDAWDRLGPGVMTDQRAELAAEHPQEEAAQRRAFRTRVPGLILSYNLYGVDIDPRAIQVAGLTLWLRAHRTWQGLKLRRTQRPQLAEARLIWAEPLPTEPLAEFGETLRDLTRPDDPGTLLAPAEVRALNQMLAALVENTALVAETGWLLPLERVTAAVVQQAEAAWRQAEKGIALDLFKGAPTVDNPAVYAVRGLRRKGFFQEAEDLMLTALTRYAERAGGPHAYQRQLFAADAARALALLDLCRQPLDVVLMNPPFGSPGERSKRTLEALYPAAKMDVFAMFVARALDRLRPGGYVGVLSSRTGLFISSFKKFRQEILLKKHLPLVADLGGEVLDAMVETAAYVIQQRPADAQHPTVFLRLLDVPKEQKEAELHAALADARHPRHFAVATPEFQVIPGMPLAYWAPTRVRATFRHETPFKPEAGDARVGLQTGDDFRFIRTWWEHPARTTRPTFAKGGNWSPFYADFSLTCKWEQRGKEMRSFGGSVIRNPTYYFRSGLTYPLRTRELSPQVMPSGTIISVRGQGIYSNPPAGRTAHTQNLLNLAVLASQPFDYLLKLMLGREGHPQFDGGAINRTPFPAVLNDPAHEATVAKLVGEAATGYLTQRERDKSRETSLLFWLPTALLPEDDETGKRASSLTNAANGAAGAAIQRQRTIEGIQARINEIVYAAYGFGKADRAAIEAFYAPTARPTSAPPDADTPAELFEPETADEDEDEDEEAEAEVAPTATPEAVAFELWQWLLGVAFGRWDMRLAQHQSLWPGLPAAFAPLPIAPPGALVQPTGHLATQPSHVASLAWLRARATHQRLPTPEEVAQAEAAFADLATSNEQPETPIAWSGLLPLDPDHPDDVARRLRYLLNLVRPGEAPGSAAAFDDESRRLLGAARASLTEWLGQWLGNVGTGGFFGRHLSQYSRAQRLAPLYWPLQAPGTDYVVWLYAPRLSRETLYALLNDYVAPRRVRAQAALAPLDALLSEPTLSTRDAHARAQRRENLQALLAGLDAMTAHLTQVLEGRPDGEPEGEFQPHPDDGAVISACLLAPLFHHNAWRRKLEETRAKLDAGDYDWAHLAYALHPRRVRAKCRTDRSLAIAHGLEHLYEGTWDDLGDDAPVENDNADSARMNDETD